MPPLDEPEDSLDLDPNAKANKEAEDDPGNTFAQPKPKPAANDDADEDGDDAGGDEAGEDADGDVEEEVEYEGKTYTLPKTLKEALMRNKDYTHGKQEQAKTRGELDGERAQLQRERAEHAETIKTSQAYIADVAEIRALDRDIAEYKKVDWRAWALSDVNAASAAQVVYTEMLRERGEKADKINAKINADRVKATAAEREAAAKFQQDLPLKIKDWSPEKRAKLKEVALKTYGFDESDFEGITDVRVMRAFDGLRELQEIKARLKTPTKSEPEPVTPVKKVPQGQARVTTAPSDKDSDAEWERKERLRMKGKGIIRY